MRGRGAGAVVLLLVIGLMSGYAASLALAGEPRPSGVAEPVTASRPRLPVETTVPAVPDPDDAALVPGIELTEETVDGGKLQIVHPVPVGWQANRRSANETKWKQPRTSNNTYVLRVAQVTSERETVETLLEERISTLSAGQDGFRVVARGPGWLEYTYRSDEGTARHSFIRWLDLDGDALGLADLEIVVHGRERDVPGTRDLVRRIAEGARTE